MKKVAIKSRGGDHGLRVIKYLESIGGNNVLSLNGRDSSAYYLIENPNNFIGAYPGIPEGYTEILLPEEEESKYPRMMWVNDTSEDSARKNKRECNIIAEVFCKYFGKIYVAFINSSNNYCTWKYAVEIEQPQTIELTLQQIAEKFDVPVEQLRIKE